MAKIKEKLGKLPEEYPEPKFTSKTLVQSKCYIRNKDLEKLIEKGDVLTREELEKLGLNDTGKVFGMNVSTTKIIELPIYGKGIKEYVLMPLKGGYQVFAERDKIKTKP